MPRISLAPATRQASYRTTPRHVQAVLARRPRSPGAARLRAVLLGDVAVTLSVLERSFVDLLRLDGLPAPLTNKPAGGRRVDCRWPEHRVTVELDGYRFHASRHAWTQDRRREREARARGDDFCRYTYDDVVSTPAVVLKELRTVLLP
jgi:very-short-patch-repair endonuclease